MNPYSSAIVSRRLSGTHLENIVLDGVPQEESE